MFYPNCKRGLTVFTSAPPFHYDPNSFILIFIYIMVRALRFSIKLKCTWSYCYVWSIFISFDNQPKHLHILTDYKHIFLLEVQYTWVNPIIKNIFDDWRVLQPQIQCIPLVVFGWYFWLLFYTFVRLLVKLIVAISSWCNFACLKILRERVRKLSLLGWFLRDTFTIYKNKAIHEETMVWQCDVFCFQAVENSHLNVFDLTRLCIQSRSPHLHQTCVIWSELVYSFKEFNEK